MRLEPRLLTVCRLLQQGSTRKAGAACRRILRENPENAAATCLLGLVHRADGDLAAAERFIRLGIELAPAVAEYRAKLGDLLRQLGRTGDAECSYRAALALDPANKAAELGLLQTLADSGACCAAEFRGRRGDPGKVCADRNA